MTRPQDLATRIRTARESLNMGQADVAKHLGVHRNTVGGWESGKHVPRTAISALERFFGIDLSSLPENTSPALDEATDAQVLADIARRLADRDREIRDVRRQLEQLRDGDRTDHTDQPGGTVVTSDRWAARPRISDGD